MYDLLTLFMLLCMLGIAFPVTVIALIALVVFVVRDYWRNRKLIR